jgi:cob(I)alamin adenosyltransferase
VFEALGATDELSSHLGLVIALAERSQHPYGSQLQRVQCLLQDIGSCVATPLNTASPAQLGKELYIHEAKNEYKHFLINK